MLPWWEQIGASRTMLVFNALAVPRDRGSRVSVWMGLERKAVLRAAPAHPVHSAIRLGRQSEHPPALSGARWGLSEH